MRAFDGKTSFRAFLNAALAFALAFSLCGVEPVSSYADELDVYPASAGSAPAGEGDGGDGESPQADGLVSDEGAASADEDAVREEIGQPGIGFVYLDASTISSDEMQNVVVVLDGDSFVVDSAELTFCLSGSESVLVAPAVRCLDDSMLFELSGLAPGSYAVVGLVVRSGDEEFSFDLGSLLGHDGTFEVVQASEEEFAETSVYSLTEDGELEEAGGIGSAIAVASEVGSALSSVSTSARTLSGYSGGEFVVAVDPGHGGSDPGAVANGLVEKELTWKIAGYCKEMLNGYAGVSGVLTRDEDECPDLDERVDRAVSAGARVFVSIHINSGGGTGAEVYYPNGSSYKKAETHDEGKALASLIQEKLAALGLADRGIKIRDSENGGTYEDGSVSDYYGVIRHAREAGIPGIIVEHAFIDNPNDSEKLKSEDFLRQLGYADAQGVLESYGFLADGEWIKGQDGRWWYSVDGTYPQSRWMRIRGVWYYFDREGWAVTGWQPVNGSWYYFDPETCAMKTGWLLLDGEWYYLASDGSMETGWLKEGSSWYHLASDGSMDTGWYSDGSHWYYLDPEDGGRMETGWLLLGDTWYWLESSGAMKIGWFEDGDSTYYFASDGAMKTGWFVVDGKRYFADPSGRVDLDLTSTVGWKFVGGSWYYYGDRGEPETGWYSDGSHWYYLDPEDGGRMAEGWLSLDGEWYWLEPGHGGMASGEWVWDGWDWYHVASSGEMQTGWYSDGAHWYYLDPESGGRALDSGWHWLGDVDYKFSSSCHMVGAWVDVPCLMQYPELPTGCESVALTDLLLYYGYSPSKTTIASSYLPRSSTNFVTAFCGNPFSFGGNLNACCAPAIVIAGNAYLEDRGNHRVVEVTGSSRGDVLSYLQNGTPVQVWSTMYCAPSPGSWTSPQWYNGRKYQLFSGTHSVVVEGYDLEEGIVYVSDPISGSVTRSAFSFFSIYSHLGSQAVIMEER